MEGDPFDRISTVVIWYDEALERLLDDFAGADDPQQKRALREQAVALEGLVDRDIQMLSEVQDRAAEASRLLLS